MDETHDNVSKAEPRLGKPRQSLELPLAERQAYTPAEVAAMFGRKQTWGYRLLYAGRVRAIKNVGRLLIPRSEVERLSTELQVHEGNPVEEPRVLSMGGRK